VTDFLSAFSHPSDTGSRDLGLGQVILAARWEKLRSAHPLQATLHDKGVRGFRASTKGSWCGAVATRRTSVVLTATRRAGKIHGSGLIPRRDHRRAHGRVHLNRRIAVNTADRRFRAITGARPSPDSRPRPGKFCKYTRAAALSAVRGRCRYREIYCPFFRETARLIFRSVLFSFRVRPRVLRLIFDIISFCPSERILLFHPPNCKYPRVIIFTSCPSARFIV
jgi:hypothetical protein